MKESNFNDLDQRLRTEQPSFSPREGFTERVMESLSARAPRRSNPARATALPWSRVLLGLATSACIVVLLVQFLPIRKGPEIAITEPPGPVEFPIISMAQVEALTAKINEPLEKELQNVISDTRQAIQFVASNFLPEN